MNLLAFADMRSSAKIPFYEDVDLICLLGKIPSKIISAIEEQYADTPIIGLLSNSCSPKHYDDTRVINIHKKYVDVHGIRFAGFGGAPLTTNETSGYYSEEEAAQFIDSLENSDVDVLLSYSNFAYGDLKQANANNGFKAYHRIVIDDIVPIVIHGRLYSDFERTLGSTTIYSVYPYKLISINKK